MQAKTISLLKERRSGEKRVLLLPDAVGHFASNGYKVLVETDAGSASGYSDDNYTAAGATIVDQHTAWTDSQLVFKYKAPGPEEYQFFREGLHLASFMHAEGNLDLTEAMRASGMTAYALEFFQSPGGGFPVPVSDNEISGKLAILMAAYHLQSHLGGNGVLLSAVAGAPRPKVVVIGYGNAGGSAARMAAALGAEVRVFGTRWEGIRRFAADMPANVSCEENTPKALQAAVLEADVVVGAILISTHDTPAMLDENLVRKMKKGAVIVDVTCGYGSGYMPTFDKLTTHPEPFYERFGVLHCKIDAMPASVPQTAAFATSSNVWRYLLGLAEDVSSGLVDETSRNGQLVSNFAVTHAEVLRHQSMQS